MEQLEAYKPEVHVVDRRTDDILFNVRFLAERIHNREAAIFLPEAEIDILEQNISEIAEADVHKLGVTVFQSRDQEIGQYISLGAGTVDHARNGRGALDLNDLGNWFEYSRREVEEDEEIIILEPQTQTGMRAGKKKVLVSPSPTHREVDPDVAVSFGYDDRTMVRLQGLSKDGQVKTMKSYSIFGVPAEAWASYYSESNGTEVDSTALSVMQHSNKQELEEGTFEEVLTSLIEGVKKHLPEEDRGNLDDQLDAFLLDQESLSDQVDFYAKEKLAFQKELALSLNNYARPAVLSCLNGIKDKLNTEAKTELSKRTINGNLFVDEYVAKLLVGVNTVLTDNRAGLATHNKRTIQRVASSIGLETTIEMAKTEQEIQKAVQQNISPALMIRANEQMLAASGATCGGGCSVEIVDLFSEAAQTARKAGLNGTLYESEELNKGSKCSCAKNQRKTKVISDGENVICVTCGDYNSKGIRGSLKKAA